MPGLPPINVRLQKNIPSIQNLDNSLSVYLLVIIRGKDKHYSIIMQIF
jgi:hypothetical protein